VKKELEMKKSEILTGDVARLLLIVFFVVPGASLFSLDVSGTDWKSHPRLGFEGRRIRFGADQRFQIGGQELIAEGTYSQTGDVITLNYAIAYDVYREDIEKIGNALSVVEIDDFFCAYKLVGAGGMEFFSRDYRPPQGEKRKIDGVTVYVYDAYGKVNENARMREGPGTQYNNVRDGQEEVIAPKGEGVSVFGRSENQTKIDGVTAYWYYCYWFTGRDHYGWIWGGLIDFRK
jgi:hypothetical protein